MLKDICIHIDANTFINRSNLVDGCKDALKAEYDYALDNRYRSSNPYKEDNVDFYFSECCKAYDLAPDLLDAIMAAILYDCIHLTGNTQTQKIWESIEQLLDELSTIDYDTTDYGSIKIQTIQASHKIRELNHFISFKEFGDWFRSTIVDIKEYVALIKQYVDLEKVDQPTTHMQLDALHKTIQELHQDKLSKYVAINETMRLAIQGFTASCSYDCTYMQQVCNDLHALLGRVDVIQEKIAHKDLTTIQFDIENIQLAIIEIEHLG